MFVPGMVLVNKTHVNVTGCHCPIIMPLSALIQACQNYPNNREVLDPLPPRLEVLPLNKGLKRYDSPPQPPAPQPLSQNPHLILTVCFFHSYFIYMWYSLIFFLRSIFSSGK